MICLVSHDVGGAELLSCWAKHKKKKFLYCIKGPALKVYKKNIKGFKNSSARDIKKKITKIITSTSKISDHEINFLKYGINKKIKTISIIDHWIDYKVRFIKNKKKTLPNEIWVTDKFAYNIAKKTFNLKVVKKKNYYIESIVKDYNKKKNLFKNKFVLYLSGRGNLVLEKKRILYFLKFKRIFEQKKLKILIKLHPSENKKKYNWLKKTFPRDIILDSKSSLKDLLLKSKYVIGCNSMAMVAGIFLGKKVFDALPPNDEKNKLPFRQIKKLKFVK